MGLLRTSFLTAYSKASAIAPSSVSDQTLRGPQFGAARPRIAEDFLGTRLDRLFRQHLHGRVATVLQRPQGVLDDAVLERVERDHDEARANVEPPNRRREKAIESLELAVHPDAQRLKGARRGVDARISAPRHGASNNRGKPAGRLNPLLLSRGDDRSRNSPGKALFSISVDPVGELALCGTRHENSCSVAARGVH